MGYFNIEEYEEIEKRIESLKKDMEDIEIWSIEHLYAIWYLHTLERLLEHYKLRLLIKHK